MEGYISENDMRKGRIVILSYYIYRGRSLFEFVCIRNIRVLFSYMSENEREELLYCFNIFIGNVIEKEFYIDIV